jgi:hypothetical protein
VKNSTAHNLPDNARRRKPLDRERPGKRRRRVHRGDAESAEKKAGVHRKDAKSAKKKAEVQREDAKGAKGKTEDGVGGVGGKWPNGQMAKWPKKDRRAGITRAPVHLPLFGHLEI